MASDAEDASPDPDFDGDFDGSEMMAESDLHPSANKTESNASASSDQQAPASKPNPKDPSRPRRKKARRACFACQRAHLTCGDERPCQRCIKRGLQDQCHDGVRKKAKYLHDTPAEALMPPGIGGYHPAFINGTKASSSSNNNDTPMTESNTATNFHTQPPPQQPQNLDIYSQPSGQPMPPPLSTGGSYTGQQSPVSPQFSQQPPSQNMQAPTTQGLNQYNGLAFDPSDPALFNFDIASLNFGNQYGALEFGMLSNMSSTANGENLPPDMLNQMTQLQNYPQNYSQDSALVFGQDAFVNANWENNHPRASSTSGLLSTPNNTPVVTSIDRQDSITHFPNAYAIGAGPSSMASASPAASTGVPDIVADQQPNSPAMFLNTSQPPSSPAIHRHPPPKQQPVQPVQQDYYPTQQSHATNHPSHPSQQPISRKRPAYDADIIYETVTKPYSYTAGFHRLFNYVARRFSTEKRLRIAKAVSAIRPSLITFSQGLTDMDLVFMERCVQRKLFEYHEFIQAIGTPCILIRRDGAIVSASKEFSILTGWTKSVLLGKEPNLNVNTGGSTGPSSANRTRLPSVERDGTKSPTVERTTAQPVTMTAQPVLLAEILDQDTVVQFYEDYAKLAFVNPTGYAHKRGKLLKYRTKDNFSEGDNDHDNGADRATRKRKRAASIKQEDGYGYIKGEAGIKSLGAQEGAVDVMYCWNVRRDVFEVPTLIVMNFLPII